MSEENITQYETVIATLEKLKTEGLTYGSFFRTEHLRELAGPWGTDKAFPFFMMELAEHLRNAGMILSCAELGGTGYRILQQVENYHATQRWHDGIGKAYDRIVTVMTSMDRGSMTDAEKIRDENWLRQMRHERLMHRRTIEVMEIIKKHKPGLLKEDQEAALET